MIESNQNLPIIIYTNHSTTVPILKQTTLNTTSTDKLNLHLIYTLQYLSSFNLELRYKAGKFNTIPNTLSRLPQATVLSDRFKKGALNALYSHIDNWPEPPVIASASSEEEVIIYHATLVKMSDNFKERLKQGYLQDVY